MSPAVVTASLVQVHCVYICGHLAPYPPACSRQYLAPRPRGPDSQRPRVASRKHCRCKAPVCIRVFLSRSSRRDSFRRSSLLTHLDFSRRGLLHFVDTHYRLILTFPSRLASRSPLFVDSSRLCISSFCSISPDGTCCSSWARLLLD